MDSSLTSQESSFTIVDSVVPFLLKAGSVAMGIFAVLAGLLYFKQDSMLYFPEIGGIPRSPRQNPRRYRSPQEYQVPFETHMIRCEDGVSIHSWLILRHDAPPNTPTLIFFHGNAGNIGLRLPNAITMSRAVDAHIFLVEYRGYGDSDTVMPSEAGLKLDAEASLRFLHQHPTIDKKRIFIFGRSLGGAVAFHLAHYAERNDLDIAGVIVENTFLSIARMVDHLMPLVAPLKPLVLRIGWDSAIIVPHLKCPVLYIGGDDDQLVPHSHMVQLRKLTKSSKMVHFHVVPGGTHNETWMQGGAEYWEKIRSFITAATMSNNDLSAGSSHHRSSFVSDDPETITGPISVSLGTDAHVPSSGIPTMPGNLMGIAKEAASASTRTTHTNKKEE